MYNVLIVDDEPRICEGLKVFINWEEMGFRVLNIAHDGEDALEKLKQDRYNLLITDIRMPKVDGLELIKAIHDQNPLVRILIISGYNKFEYAKEAMEYGVRGYLLKPLDRDDLLQYVSRIKNELDKEFGSFIKNRENNTIALNKFLFDLANGALSKEDIILKMQEYTMDLNKNKFLLGLIDIEDYLILSETNLEDANLQRFSVKNIIDESITENKMGYVYDDIQGMLGIIFYFDKSDFNEEALFEYLYGLCRCIKNYLNININIGYGDIVSKITDLKSSRKQAQIALERRIVLGREAVIPYNKVMDEKSILDFEWSNEKLLSSIHIADKSKVTLEVDYIINEISKRCFSNEVIHGITYNIIFGICAIVKSYNGDARELVNDDNGCIKMNFANILQLKEWLKGICLKTCDYILDLQERKATGVFNQVKKYIDDNYYKDLSLKSLAENFYMNPAYLGRLFKNNMGENFNDYLNKIRISELKKRILQKDSKIYDLISEVGYSNHEHFYRQFKHFEGVSFVHYKESIKQNK